jgi:hypothetical protein
MSGRDNAAVISVPWDAAFSTLSWLPAIAPRRLLAEVCPDSLAASTMPGKLFRNESILHPTFVVVVHEVVRG